MSFEFKSLLPIAFAVIGFITKYLVDYFYLKSPKLQGRVVMRSGGCGPPSNGYRRYSYTATITINNFSENIAYDFKLLSFVLDSKLLIATPFNEIKLPVSPVASNEPVIIGIEYYATLEVTKDLTGDMGYGQLEKLSSEFILKYSYQNGLGKKYIKEERGAFTLHLVKNNFIVRLPVN